MPDEPRPVVGNRPHRDGISLGWAYASLKRTGRGKHIGRFSYYHRTLAEECDDVLDYLEGIASRVHDAASQFNVIKLDHRSRVSYLRYEDFATSRFPALLWALSCDLSRATARWTDYSGRRNPPILHRKELLLRADSPLVPEAARLTRQLERLGAFADPRRIGTRKGWISRLETLGLTLDCDACSDAQ